MGVPLMRTKTWAYAHRRLLRRRRRRVLRELQVGRVPGGLLLQHLGLPALHGDPRRDGELWGVILGGMILGYLTSRASPTIGSKIQDAGLDFDPTKYQFGIYGIIIVLMMLFRPPGLIPERGTRSRSRRACTTRRSTTSDRGRAHRPRPERRLMAARQPARVDEGPQGVRRPGRLRRHRLHDPARLDRRADRARTAPARRRSSTRSRASTTRPRARSCSTGRRSPGCRRTRSRSSASAARSRTSASSSR